MKTTKDLDLLRALADFRLATTILLARCLGTSEQMIRRRCRKLVDEGLIVGFPRNPGQARGRPEWVFSLTSEGVRPLTTANLLAPEVPVDQVTGENVSRIGEHQMMLNELALDFASIETGAAHFLVRFISSTSPFHLSKAGATILRDKVAFADGTEVVFTPDAAVCITHRGLSKSLLFLVEIDRATETIADPGNMRNADIRHKIIVYRNYLGKGGYKRYESPSLFAAHFSGFRLLLVAASKQRNEALCRLIRQIPPSDFVWAADCSALNREGIAAHVWAVGGQNGAGRSIVARQETGAAAQRGGSWCEAVPSAPGDTL